jgi:hypothetical protein
VYSYSPATGLHKLNQFIIPGISPSEYIEKFHFIFNELNPDEMYVVSDWGIFKSTNAMSNFTSPDVYRSDYGLRARDFNSVAASRSGRVMGGSLSDGAYINIGSSGNFYRVAEGSFFCEFSQLDSNYLFTEDYYGWLVVSGDTGASFNSPFDLNIDPQGYGAPTGCGGTFPGSNAPFVTPYILYETKSAFNTTDSVSYTSVSGNNAGDSVQAVSSTASIPFKYALPAALGAGQSIQVPDPIKARIFISTYCGVWMERQAITPSISSWYLIARQLNGTPNCFVAIDNGNTLITGTSRGFVYKTTGMNQAHYTLINNTMYDSLQTDSFGNATGGRPIEGLAVDKNNDSVIIVAVSGYSPLANVFKTTNGGQTWSPIQVGPAFTPAYTCVIDANNSNNYVVGTEHGVWTSHDAGATWAQDDQNMCDVPVYRLRQLPLLTDDCMVLYAATNSRGLWRSFTLTPSGCNTTVGIQNITPDAGDFKIYPNPASSVTTVEFDLTESNKTELKIFDLQGRLMQAENKFLPAGNQKLALNTSQLQSGTYLVTLQVGETQKTKLLVVM